MAMRFAVAGGGDPARVRGSSLQESSGRYNYTEV
jgi:hypothetical protein